MRAFFQDVRYGLRVLAKNRGSSAVILLILSIGTGANTAIFTLVNAVLIRPLPGVSRPEELIRLYRKQSRQITSNFGYPDYVDYRDRSKLFAGLAAQAGAVISFANGTPKRLSGAAVSGNYFPVLGVQPALGRLLNPDDDQTEGAHWVAVISHSLWRQAFGADPAAVGRRVMLNGYSFTVVGVAHAGFRGAAIGGSVDVWVPLMMHRQAVPRLAALDMLRGREFGWLSIYGRLNPGVSLDQARAEISSIARRLELQYPATNEGREADVVAGVGLSPAERANLRRFLGLLFAAVALVLLIACGNVATLLVARAGARRREIAVRLAVGAGRARLIRQLLTESVLLAVPAAAAGLLLTPWILTVLLRFVPPYGTALRAAPAPDSTVFAFTLSLAVLTGILFGLAPALQASRVDLVASLKDAAPASRRKPGLQDLLVITQVALSLVLLSGAGLVLRTMQRILAIDRGFETEHVLLASVDLAIQGYSEARGMEFYVQLLDRILAIPSVRAASVAKTNPATGYAERRSVFYEGQEPPPEVRRRRTDLGIRAEINSVSPGYFRTLEIPLLAGRDFTWQDRAGSTRTAILSRRLAEQLWPGQNPIGKRLAVPDFSGPPQPPVEVIGVAKDGKFRSLLAEAPLLLYLPILQNYQPGVDLQIQTAGDPTALVPVLRREVAALDPNLPVFDARTLGQQVDQTLWEQRAAAGLIGSFGLVSLALACVGLFSALAHSVSLRRHEIGIRMALGARQRDVRAMVVRDGLALASAGVIVGLGAALLLTRLIASFLYGVSPTDPLTFLSVSLLLIAVSTAASYLPAREATRVDPLIALRQQ